jgi:DNA-binding NtrC family response regulator
MMLRNPNVLLLSNVEMESAGLERLLSEHVGLTPINSLSELASQLEANDYDALFCANVFNTGTWNDALDEVQKVHPDLPVIILSSSAGEREWLQALDAGAFDLLSPPYHGRSLLAVLEQASASREARISRGSVPCKSASA